MGSIPNVTLTWIHIGCFTARLRLPKNDKHRCSVGRAHDSYYAFLFFFFVCLSCILIYSTLPNFGTHWARWDQVTCPNVAASLRELFFVWSAWKKRAQPRRLYEYYFGPPKRRVPKNANKPRKQYRNRPCSEARNEFSYRQELCYETAIRASPTVYCGH